MASAPTSYAGLAADFNRALVALRCLGIDWTSTRFDGYRKAIGEAASWVFPRPIESREVRDVLHESLIQARQLIGISEIWNRFPEEVLVSKLRAVVGGHLLPPTASHAPDHARNTLLELSMARYLILSEFEVSITSDQEDVVAVAAGFRFSVECKRPTNPNSLEKNLRKAKTQLKSRKVAGRPSHGFVVIGIDRLSNVSGANAAVQSLAELTRRVHEGMQRGANEVARVANHVGLDAYAAIGALVFTAPIWIEDQGQPWTVQQITTFRLSQLHSDRVAAAAVQPLLNREFGAEPANLIVTP